MTVKYKGQAKRLDDIDLPRIGARIGVGEDELHAFMEVEAAGNGFDSQGRVKMLFEPHVFWRNLAGAEREAAAAAGLAYPKWKRNYPADSYPRFLEACKINETAACKAASLGLGQILGENYAVVGYASPQAMIESFAADEENQLNAMVNFLINKKIDDDLRAHNWLQVEKVYNGGGYGGAYAAKMEKAYAKWRGIRDTPYSPEEPKPVPPQPDLEPDTEMPGYEEPAKPGSAIAKVVIAAIAAAIAAFFGWIATGGD